MDRRVTRWTAPLALAGMALCAATATADETVFAVSNTANEIYRVDVSNAGVFSVGQTINNPTLLLRPYGITTRHNGDLLINSRGPCTGCNGGDLARMGAPTCDAPSSANLFAATAGGLRNPHGALAIGDLGYMVDTYNNRIVRYALTDGATTFIGSDPTGGGSAGCRSITFHRGLGQVFVSDCCQLGGIRRFTLAADGSLAPAGTITGNGMNNPHGMTISPAGELFVCNINGNSLSRFLFNAAGDAIPNGVISGFGLNGPVSATFLASGELLVVGHFTGVITRLNVSGPTPQLIGTFTMPTGCGELTTLGAPANFGSSPARTGICIGENLSLTVVGAPAQSSFQWQQRDDQGVWQNLSDGPRPFLATVSGATSPQLTLSTLTALDAGTYRCAVTGACGTDFSSPSRITFCEGDADCDADTDSDDVVNFFGFWEQGDLKADVDGDGDTDSDDIVAFFGSWDNGC